MKTHFCCYGHANILATHRTTLEITEDAELTKKGTCIIGMRAKLPDLRDFLQQDRVTITITAGAYSETLSAKPNREYTGGHEFVVRMGEYSSPRTFAVHSDKAAIHLDRRLVALLRNPDQEIRIDIT
jgi:hypothetical protein